MHTRLPIGLLAGILLVSVLPAVAMASRKAEGTYASPAVGVAGRGVAGCANQDAAGCVVLPGGPEKFVHIKIEDSTGADVSASMSQDTDGDQLADEGSGGEFCTETEQPFPVVPGYEVNVFIFTGPCTDGTPAAATSGKVIGTFLTNTGTDSGGTPGTTVTGAGARLRLSDYTPKFGSTIKGTAYLKKCPGHAGTTILVQKKVGSSFKTIMKKKLNSSCKATFKMKANFKKSTFRALWKKQDDDHKTSKSRPRTVTTHR